MSTARSILIVFLAVSILLLSGVPPHRAEAQSVSVLYVNPLHTLGNNSFAISVALNLSLTETINAFDVRLSYNSTVLNATKLELGNLFSGGRQELVNCVNGVGLGCTSSDTAGIVHSAVVALGLQNAVSGPKYNATLFQVQFNVVGNGTSVLHIFDDNLVNPSTSPPAAIVHLDIDGVFSNHGLAALFNVSPAILIVGRPVYFNATGTFNPNNSTARYVSSLNYTWDFGEGGQLGNLGPVPSHTYTAPGDYNVKLNVTDVFGATAKTNKTITVLSSLGQIQITILDAGGNRIPSLVIASLYNGTSLVGTLAKQADIVFFQGLKPGTYRVDFAGTGVVPYSKVESVFEGRTTQDTVYLTVQPTPPAPSDNPASSPPDLGLPLVALAVSGSLVLAAFAVFRSGRGKKRVRGASARRRISS